MLAEPLHEPKVRQGVTTELIGVDGNAYAPFPSRRDLDDYVVLNAGLDGRPDIAYDWSTVAEYLARYDRATSVNVAYVVGQLAAPDRLDRLGRGRGRPRRRWPTSGRACARPWRMARSACRPGLDYPPGSVRHDRRAGRAGGRGRPAGRASTTPTSATRWATASWTRTARRSRSGGAPGAPVHITHFYHRPTFPGSPEDQLALVDDARAEGLDVTFDLYPYEWASTRLLIMLPQWMQAGGLGPLRERLADRRVRERVRAENAVLGRRFAGDRSWDEVRLGRLHPARERRVGGPDAGRLPGGDRRGPGGRDLRPAPRRGPARQPGDAGPAPGGHRARSSAIRRR